MNLHTVVRKEITAGVLIGGLFLSGILWFLAYTEEKAETMAAFTINMGLPAGDY